MIRHYVIDEGALAAILPKDRREQLIEMGELIPVERGDIYADPHPQAVSALEFEPDSNGEYWREVSP